MKRHSLVDCSRLADANLISKIDENVDRFMATALKSRMTTSRVIRDEKEFQLDET